MVEGSVVVKEVMGSEETTEPTTVSTLSLVYS